MSDATGLIILFGALHVLTLFGIISVVERRLSGIESAVRNGLAAIRDDRARAPLLIDDEALGKRVRDETVR